MSEGKPKPKATKAKPAEGAKRAAGMPASQLIDERIRELGDWRGEALSRMRKLILEADPEMVEEWKWMGTPVWSHDGNVCTGESYKQVVKLTFAHGAALADPKKLFNSSLDGNTRRAIDIHEDEEVDAKAFKALVKAAVSHNLQLKAPKAKPAAKEKAKPAKAKMQKNEKGVVLLLGGNPQIAKGDGDVPVQKYIDALTGWKHDLTKRVDALIVQTVPSVRKVVKWNSPFYGIEGQGWFLSFHVFTKYVKVAFFKGASLKPLPPGESKSQDTRYLDIYEKDELDETQLASWVKQAAALPGWIS